MNELVIWGGAIYESQPRYNSQGKKITTRSKPLFVVVGGGTAAVLGA
jgi:hypothetical protein